MSNELVKANALPVREMSDLAIVGQAIAQSGMFGVKNQQGGMVIAVTCHQQGITLMDYHRTYHTIDGRPSMKADAMLAGFRKAGGKYAIIENSLTRAAAKFTFEGKTYDFAYTLDDAMRTHDCLNAKGEVKDIWKKRPDDMLWARLVSRAVRRLTPEVNAGLYTPEEVQDFDPPPATAKVEVITPNDAASRASALAKPAETFSKADCPDLCPIGEGEFLYKPWHDFDSVSLEQAFRSENPRITADHKHQIAVILADRGIPVPADDDDIQFTQ